MIKEMSDAHKAILLQRSMKDPHSMGVIKALGEVYPVLQKKLFEGNALMEKLVMSGFSMMDIMDYPICGTCESLALYNGEIIKDNKVHRRCTCIKPGCFSSTIDPPTLKQWLRYELKKKMPADEIEELDFKIDKIAEHFINMHKAEMRNIYLKRNAEANKAMGIDNNSKKIYQEQAATLHYKKSVIPEDAEMITDDLLEDDQNV
jgi:hypothetical protein